MKLGIVLAHYSKLPELEASFIRFIENAAQIGQIVLIISTSPIRNRPSLPNNVKIIERSNVGLDFCSYRYGIELLQQTAMCNEILIANNSIFFSQSFNFKKIIVQLVSHPAHIVGLVANRQYVFHLQSYFLLFKKSVIQSIWFHSFWSCVQPLDKKLQIIQQFEIGLSRSALQAGLTLGALFEDQKIVRWKQFNSWLSRLKRRAAAVLLRPPENPTFFQTQRVYEKLGILKWEWVFASRASASGAVKSWILAQDQLALATHAGLMPSDHKFRPALETQDHLINWFQDKVLDLKNQKPAKIAVVLHLFYPDLMPEIFDQLKLIPEKFDLYISVPDIYEALGLKKYCRETLFLSPIVFICENRGRDVGPFVHILNLGLLQKHELVCKIHGKKSRYSLLGATWRNEIFREILGSSENIISIFNAFRSDPETALIGPSKTFITDPAHWGSNKETLEKLFEKIQGNSAPLPLRFFAGTMFWFRPDAFKKIGDQQLTLLDFEEEKGQLDGTFAHAFERLFVSFVEANGKRVQLCGGSYSQAPLISKELPLVYRKI